MDILHRDDLARGGFAGLKEHQLVMDPQAFGERAGPGTWPGIGNFVYLADARFDPLGETRMHGHKEIDVISVMVEGRIAHAGSMEHGQELSGNAVQVQRAGGEGFSHNEINPDDHNNRMIQLWALPERPGEAAGYKLYEPKWGETAHIYGGETDQKETYAAETMIDVSLLHDGQTVSVDGPFLAYVTKGAGQAGDETVADGDLIRGDGLQFTADGKTQLITIYRRP